MRNKPKVSTIKGPKINFKIGLTNKLIKVKIKPNFNNSKKSPLKIKPLTRIGVIIKAIVLEKS